MESDSDSDILIDNLCEVIKIESNNTDFINSYFNNLNQIEKYIESTEKWRYSFNFINSLIL